MSTETAAGGGGPQAFEAWGVVDLFGHTRIAGRISEQTIGGETFIRVDVPTGESFHTRLFGKGAIYGISITDEAIAREVAKRHVSQPVSPYDCAQLERDITARIEDRRRIVAGDPEAFHEPDDDY